MFISIGYRVILIYTVGFYRLDKICVTYMTIKIILIEVVSGISHHESNFWTWISELIDMKNNHIV